MLTSSFIAALLLTATTNTTEITKPVVPSPAKELEQLKFFEGEWKCEGKMEQSEWGPAHAIKGTSSTKLEFNGMWYSVSFNEEKTKDYPGMMMRGYWGYDTAGKQFTRLFVGSNGEYETATSQGWVGNEMTWTGKGYNFMGKTEVEFKHTFIKKGDREYTDRMETNNDGTWTAFPCKVVCKKQAVRS